jgi:phosphoglycolate phosphatase-like HAD superfamily hydrolase
MGPELIFCYQGQQCVDAALNLFAHGGFMKDDSSGNAPTKLSRRTFVSIGAGAVAFAGIEIARGEAMTVEQGENDSLRSWNDGPAKSAILSFVRDTTDKSSSKYVEPADRIATFDQDGTLWTEHPLYGQAAFALARVGEMAATHPEWKQTEPFKTVLARDYAAMSKFTETDWMQIVAVTHAGMSTEAFQGLVKDWLAKARAPRFDRPYTDLVYQPMLEVMQYLRANGFRTYIVTGGGQEFVRVYSEKVYGVPPEHVVGSSIVTRYEDNGGKPELMREPKPFFIDDGPGKAIGINLFIGKRPQAAFGNSGSSDLKSGDAQMLEWTQAGDGAHLLMLVLHDDAKREYAYGPAKGLPDTGVGTFSETLLAEATKNAWTVISMKNDWKRIFAWES